MITPSQISREFDLAKKIYLYYWDKMADMLSIGSDRYVGWYKDLCQLYYLTQMMESVYAMNGKLYIGDEQISEDDFILITYNAREFLSNDLREEVYAGLDSEGNVNDYTNPGTPITIVAYSTFTQDWKDVIVEITQDDVTTVTLPFNINNTDPQSIRLNVEDSDPINISNPSEEGFHIIGNTLYWHTYFNLKAGDRLYIQYLETTNF
jgi:hypothetical protein